LDIFEADMANAEPAHERLPRLPRQIHRVAVMLCRHHSLASLGLVMDTFRMANQVPGTHRFELLRVSADGLPVPHPDGLLGVDGGVALLARAEAVLIPSLWTQGEAAVAENTVLIEALRDLPPAVLVASLCTGAYLLAATGRLDSQPATLHWNLAQAFQQRFPQVRVQAQETLTEAGGLICSGGSMAAMDGCLHVLRRLADRDTARRVAQMMVMDERHGPQTQYMPAYGWRRHGDRQMRRVEACLVARHAEPLTLDELATLAHVSVRTLQRRFLAATGMTPIQYQQAVRIERAKALLEAGQLAVSEVAAQVGYQDRVAFGRLFKKAAGMTPAAWRQRHPSTDFIP
jgi:transcriptional regulator GlxA family with amidase domain